MVKVKKEEDLKVVIHLKIDLKKVNVNVLVVLKNEKEKLEEERQEEIGEIQKKEKKKVKKRKNLRKYTKKYHYIYKVMNSGF